MKNNIENTLNNLINLGLVIEKSDYQDFKKFYDLKGYKRYETLLKFILSKSGKDSVTYKSLSDSYKYDVRIRRTIIKYLIMYEEYLKACISNNIDFQFENEEEFKSNYSNLFTSNTKLENKLLKLFREKDIKYLSSLLDELTFYDITEIINCIIDNAFYKTNIDSNALNTIREMRNAVMHHKILPLYTYNNKNITDAITTLSNCLPVDFRKGFLKEICNCKYDFIKEDNRSIKKILELDYIYF